MCTLLKVTDVTKIYKNQTRPGLDPVSFEVEKGEFLGIMGASGSGKTTLLNVLSTIDPPTGGDISMGNVKIQKLNPTKAADFRKNNLGFIFQDGQIISELRRNRRKRRDFYEEIMREAARQDERR